MRKKKRERRGTNRLRKKEEANKYIFALDLRNENINIFRKIWELSWHR